MLNKYLYHQKQQAKNAAVKTLEMMGYTYHGAELWMPPLGNSSFHKSFSVQLADQIEAVLQQLGFRPCVDVLTARIEAGSIPFMKELVMGMLPKAPCTKKGCGCRG